MLRRGLTESDLRQYLLELCAPLRWSLWVLSFYILGAPLLGAGMHALKVLYVFRVVPSPTHRKSAPYPGLPGELWLWLRLDLGVWVD